MADSGQDRMTGDVDQEAREAAKRYGLNFNEIKGTGTNGQITKADVEAHAAKTGAVTPSGTNPSGSNPSGSRPAS